MTPLLYENGPKAFNTCKRSSPPTPTRGSVLRPSWRLAQTLVINSRCALAMVSPRPSLASPGPVLAVDMLSWWSVINTTCCCWYGCCGNNTVVWLYGVCREYAGGGWSIGDGKFGADDGGNCWGAGLGCCETGPAESEVGSGSSSLIWIFSIKVSSISMFSLFSLYLALIQTTQHIFIVKLHAIGSADMRKFNPRHVVHNLFPPAFYSAGKCNRMTFDTEHNK